MSDDRREQKQAANALRAWRSMKLPPQSAERIVGPAFRRFEERGWELPEDLRTWRDQIGLGPEGEAAIPEQPTLINGPPAQKPEPEVEDDGGSDDD